jgi:hypothetical protein
MISGSIPRPSGLEKDKNPPLKGEANLHALKLRKTGGVSRGVTF